MPKYRLTFGPGFFVSTWQKRASTAKGGLKPHKVEKKAIQSRNTFKPLKGDIFCPDHFGFSNNHHRLPAFAAGGKNHGEVGKGEVHQGDCGDAGNPDTNEAPGDNAQGNQAD